MNRNRLLFGFITILILCLLLASCSTAKRMKRMVVTESGPKKKVAFLGIANRTEFPMEEYARELDQALLERLARTGELKVYTPQEARAAGLNKADSSTLDITPYIPAAKRLGLNAIIKGDISELEITHKLYGIYGFRDEKPTLQMVIRLQLVDVESHTILYEGYRSGKMKLNLPEGLSIQDYLKDRTTLPRDFSERIIRDMGDDIVATMADQPWRSYILAADANRILLSAGEDVGLRPGDTLAVWSTGLDVVNYAGHTFRMPGDRVGVIRCETVKETTATAVIVEGEGFEVGYAVSLPNS